MRVSVLHNRRDSAAKIIDRRRARGPSGKPLKVHIISGCSPCEGVGHTGHLTNVTQAWMEKHSFQPSTLSEADIIVSDVPLEEKLDGAFSQVSDYEPFRGNPSNEANTIFQQLLDAVLNDFESCCYFKYVTYQE